MSFTPQSTISVKPLPRGRRRFVFISMLFFFLCAVPVFMFYATGYRYDIFNRDLGITSTGGMYINVGAKNGEVYLNETPVQDSRIFRNAIYIQNLTPGMQRLHVQASGLHTWVKELPVYPNYVTEASAFLLPLWPQVRPITEYETATGTLVFLNTASTTILFNGASTSVPFLATSSKATTTLTRNSEYTFIKSLFATTSSATSTLLTRVVGEVTDALSLASNNKATTSTSTATTTKIMDKVRLYEDGDDVVIEYTGPERNIPYYFCVPIGALASTSELYGPQVMRGVASALAASPLTTDTSSASRLCRKTITIDRQNQTVISFDFFPGTTDLVVMHRTDGVYVTEVDDRSWQNTQALYPWPIDEMVQNNGRLYAKSSTTVFELLTELPLP